MFIAYPGTQNFELMVKSRLIGPANSPRIPCAATDTAIAVHQGTRVKTYARNAFRRSSALSVAAPLAVLSNMHQMLLAWEVANCSLAASSSINTAS